MNTGFSGELCIKDDNASKNLFFKNGNLVFAKSNLYTEQLGEMLLVLGRINEDQYNKFDMILITIGALYWLPDLKKF